MKRIVFLLIFSVFAVGIAQAQTRDVRRASRSLNRGDLQEAKGHMDAAMQDQSALADPQTWVVNAQLHMEIFNQNQTHLAESPLEVAFHSLEKADELDTRKTQILQIQQSYLVLSEMLFNEGVEFYNANKFGNASNSFLRAYELSKNFGGADTTTLFNAALSAELDKNYDRAMKYYKELDNMEYDQPALYSSMANIAFHQGDTLASIEHISRGRERFPDDLNLIFSEANIHIFSGNVEKASEVLDLAISRDPDNPNLYFAFGANYDKMVQDPEYSDEERRFAFREAINAYEKAIELDPDYFDAVYNLGVLYFNEGIRIFEEAEVELRKTNDFAAYEKNEQRFREMWLNAQPYLERSMEMLPDNDPNLKVVVVSLMQLYVRTNQHEKYQQIEPIYRRYFAAEEE
jgi:tetratricopeptide (TPR) repeat protein